MALPITVPRLGWNMEEGVFVEWLKHDGDTVRAGEPLFRLEGDKAVQDIESTDSGILRIAPDAPQPGASVKVGDLLGYLAALGETISFGSPARSTIAATAEVRPPSPAVAAVVAESSLPQVGNDRPAISPRARRVAAELGVNWTQLRGSGRTGRIRERDVRAAAAQRHPDRPAAADQVQPITPTRRLIAERMVSSLRTTAPVTLTTTADATNLVNLRAQFQAMPGDSLVPSYTDCIVKLTACALQAHPLLNARWEEDHIVLVRDIHIGIAVDTESGLRVPVVRDVPALALRQLAARTRDLTERARGGKLTPGEMQGGTFTVSNLGPFGIDAFTPIINHPECAILGVGRIQRLPAVVDNQIVPRDVLTLSLTFDHRIVDGAPAARFLDSVRQCLENPVPWLLP
jgi:pyruvate dehydrogenase E2 component (dihydrolipoamide acetyltransferase)